MTSLIPPAPGAEYPERLRQDSGFVGGQVDHAVGDDDIHVLTRQRNVLDVAVQELSVGYAGLRGVFPGEGDHVRGAVQAVDLPARDDTAGGQQHVDSAARTEIQHGIPGVHLGDSDGVAAAEAGPQGAAGQFAVLRIPGGTEAGFGERAGIAVGDLLPGACRAGETRVAGGDGRPDLVAIRGDVGAIAGLCFFHR